MKKGILIIRKYKNRRLYDTEQSIYITREELLELIRNGRDVQIQDANTNQDVTVEILLQLMISDCQELLAAIPPDFIHFLIRSSGSSVSSFFTEFIPFAMQTWKMNMEKFQNQQQQFVKTMFPFAPFPGFVSPFSMNPFFQSQEEPVSESSVPKKEEIDELKSRLQQLEKMLGKK